MIELILLSSATVAAILIVLLKTDFIGDYLDFFIVNRTWRMNLLLGPYRNVSGDHPNILFYWYEKFSERPVESFFLKLVTCPYCAGFWLATILSVVMGVWFAVGVVYILSLLMFFTIDRLSKI